jgi:hypothetical protein
MKNTILTLLLFLGLASNSPGAFLGQMRSAETSGMGSLNLMGNVGIFENARLVTGTVRYGIATPVDITGSLAIMDHDASDNVAIMLGGDLQWRLTHADLGAPLDIAIGVMAEYYSLSITTRNNVSNIGLGFNFIGSRPVKLENGLNFTPYGRLNLRIDRSQTKLTSETVSGSVTKGHDSKFNIGVNVGSVFPLSGKVNLIGELQIDDELGFVAGINFLMW